MTASIALLGQPNSGKSTIYNNLTGSRQHVGNWAGKTVEKNEGTYTYEGTKYSVTDLPGSYGLSGNSDEEIITTDFIKSGQSELTVVLVDASQLERSMFMLAEFARLDKPALLVLNMIDVAKDMGKEIDADALSEKLGIPVLPFNATDTKDYDRLKKLIAEEMKAPHRMTVAAPAEQADVKADSREKFEWVSELISGVTKTRESVYKMSKFDRLMTRPVLGKVICIGVVLLAFLVAMIIMIPFMSIGQMISGVLHDPVDQLLTGWNVHPWIVSIFSTMIPNVLYFTISMASFVFGVNIVFGFLEETGFLARAAYQFDGLLSKLGLQGKAICPMLMGFGCTIGGACGTRVMDNWGQRMLAMSIVWAIPCASIWSIIPVISGMFFSWWQTICASVTSHIITSARDLAVSRIQTKTSLSVESAMMMRLMSLPAPFFRKYSSGELASRAKSVNNLCGLLIGMVFSMGLTSLLSLFYIGQIFEFAPGLTLPAVVIIAVTVAVIIMTTLYQTSITRREMEHSAKESGLTYSIMTGVQKIKLAGAEKRVFAKWAEHYSEGAELIYDPPLFLKINNAVTLGVSLIGTMILYYLAVITGVSQSEYIAFNTSYGMIMGAFGSLAQVAKVIGEIRPILEMAEPILTEIPETSAHKQFVTRVNGNVELNNVYFRYNENMPYIVDGLDLRIRSGEYIAIVGKTGCGKSTLLRLLLGFENPEKGAIYYDGNDTTKIDLRSLRRKIGVVTQNDDLFQGDIFSNIAIASPSLTLEETWEAAELAGIADDIRDMPMGMQTVIGEGQGGISGGQKQRIMIARAIASKPKILMFDEATSALDNKTQKIVSEALDGLKCTRIVIAHRLSTIKNCDRILVLDNGKIVEDGTYDELIARNGCFAELVERQRIGDDTNKCCKFGEKP